MSIKFTRSAANQYLSAPDGAQLTFPNSDWVMGAVVVFDGTAPGNSEAQYLLSTGTYGSAGSFELIYYPPTANNLPGKVVVNLDTNTATAAPNLASNVAFSSGAYLFVIQRSGTTLTMRHAPILATLPSDGSSVVADSTATLSMALDGPAGLFIGARSDLTPLRFADQSLARFFFLTGTLTDLEVAKLAYGMQITDIGKTPLWYVRMDTASDYADIGSQANTITPHGTLVTGTAPGFGYNSTQTPTAPVITGSPSIVGGAQVGSAASFTPASVTGFPSPTRTIQWRVDGVALSGATGTTYTPVAGDAGKSLSVSQTETNTQGTASTTSAGVTVAASGSTIDVAQVVAERIYQRTAGVALLPMNGNYSGTVPTSIEIQLYAPDGSTVLVPWVALTSPVIGSGNWTGSLQVPQGGMYRLAARGKSGTTVLATSNIKANLFGVGDLIATPGSSSANRWYTNASGTGYVPRSDVRLYRFASWGVFGTDGCAIQMANSFAVQAGVPIGMISAGVEGETLANWLNMSGSSWTSFASSVTTNGSKLGGVMLSMGSNDAANGIVVSRAQHLANLRQFIANVRTLTSQSDLKVLISGFNRRPNVAVDQADFVRMAENDAGDDANVYQMQTVDLELSSDLTHLSVAGFTACATRMQTVFGLVMNGGQYRRGPKLTSISWAGNSATATVFHRNGSDITPTSGIAGLTVTDSDSSGVAPTITSAVRASPTQITWTFNRNLVAPVFKYLSGASPVSATTTAPANTVFDNGATALPMSVETGLTAVAATDSQAPTLTNASATQTGSTTATGSVTTDEANGTLYSLVNTSVTATASQVQAGSTKAVTATGVQSVPFTGLPAATLLYPHFVHVDAAGNVSTVANGAGFTTAAAPDTTAPTLSAASATATGTTTATASVTTNEGNGTLYSLVSTSASATAAQVKAGASQAVLTAGVKTISATGLPSGTAQYFYFLHRDAANNDSAVLQSPIFTTSAVVPPPQQGNGQSGVTFIPSKARTLKVKAAALTFEGGAFWDLSNPRKPSGRKDPDSIIDITLDWSDVLDDITDTIASIDWTVKNATSAGSYPAGVLTTLFVSGGGTVSTVIEITATMTTASNPPRKEDRTVYLKVEQL